MTDHIGKQFMKGTRYPFLPESAQRLRQPQPPLELPYPAGARLIDLPDPASLQFPPADIRAMIEQRRSVRGYSPQPLTLAELAYLLWLTQGVKEVIQRPATLRTVPSAGARHAFETYLLLNRVEGIAPGVYRYIALEHALLEMDRSDGIDRRLVEACHDQEMVGRGAATFFWVAVAERMEWRYPVRGYRYLHLDAGHVCQNLYLAAESIGCGMCAIAAYDDEQLNQALGLDGEELFVIYLAALGKKDT